ncbi:MAG: hypothetical protein GMKNLPBB_01453 [Myxococcota bacterium]|nr:hypothetical protein [Myxococcota bacterium]
MSPGDMKISGLWNDGGVCIQMKHLPEVRGEGAERTPPPMSPFGVAFDRSRRRRNNALNIHVGHPVHSQSSQGGKGCAPPRDRGVPHVHVHSLP